MVIEPEIAVRFLIESPTKYRGTLIQPWRLYRYNRRALTTIGLPYEELPPGPLRVGTRLESVVRLAMPGVGCCSSCTEMQSLLDYVDVSWVRKHRDEIVDEIKANAGRLTKLPITRRMIRIAITAAIVLERRAYRAKYTEILGASG